MMNKVEVRKEVIKKCSVVVEYVAKPALLLNKCDACGKTFRMDMFCNDEHLALMVGTFDKCVNDNNGRGLGNGFYATACSFKCAHRLFAEDGWKKMSLYKPYAVANAKLVRAELKITSYITDGTKLAAEWDKSPENKPKAEQS